MSAFDNMNGEDVKFFKKNGFISKPTKSYDLVYKINNRVHETICSDKTYQFCNYMKTQKSESGRYIKKYLVIIKTEKK